MSEPIYVAEAAKPKSRKQADVPKTVRIWALQTISSNKLAITLTGMSATGSTIFKVLHNPNIGGSFDVVSYTDTAV